MYNIIIFWIYLLQLIYILYLVVLLPLGLAYLITIDAK